MLLAVLGGWASAQGVLPGEPKAGSERIEAAESFVEVTFEGVVFDGDGVPAEGAVVVTSAGGQAVTDWNGTYRLESRVPAEAESLQITAVGPSGTNLQATTSVQPPRSSGPMDIGPLVLAQGATCSPSWLPTFGGQPGTDYPVYALAVFDDGGGPALYAGGYFFSAGGVKTTMIAKWDGSSWAPLGSGMNYATVHALTVFDDGGGPALYAAGGFSTAGGVAANRIAKWDGSSWAALGSGMNNDVYALTTFDDGAGPALYAGGKFTTAGGLAANRIAKWDGSSWAALGSGIVGVFGVFPEVRALTVFDDGAGPALYAGGIFTTAGGVTARGIAKWDGWSWAGLGSKMDGGVHAMTVFDDGAGPALYVGGAFTTAAGLTANYVATWDGSSWTALDSGIGGGFPPQVRVLTSFDDGAGPALYAGGDFMSAGGLGVNRIAKSNGSSWAALGSGMDNWVNALTVFDDGGGPALYAGGFFTTAGGVAANRIAKWDGSSWAALGSGMDGPLGAFPGVYALTVFDDGGGPALYVGGTFAIASGLVVYSITKWDGASWTALGSGMNGGVHALTVFDDGAGPALYAGGSFTTAGAWQRTGSRSGTARIGRPSAVG